MHTFLHVKKKAQVRYEKVQSQITTSLQNKGHSHNEFSKCHLKAYVTILLASAQGIDTLFSMSCFPTSCPWLMSFAHPYFVFNHVIFSCFSFDLLYLRLCWAHTSTTVPPPMSEQVIDYSNPPTYFISATLPAERGTWKIVGMASFAIFILTFSLF